MKVVCTMATVDGEKCTGCKKCGKVCPVLAISTKDKKIEVDVDLCTGCGLCEQRCPAHAISIIPREVPRTIEVVPSPADRQRIAEICSGVKLLPEQVICYCTGTRADEVVAAILKGATSPEMISAMTGARTGCGVLCIQNILRLCQGAGLDLKPSPGYQWYGKPITLWDLSEEAIQKYSRFGNRILEDRKLIESILEERGRRSGHETPH